MNCDLLYYSLLFDKVQRLIYNSSLMCLETRKSKEDQKYKTNTK